MSTRFNSRFKQPSFSLSGSGGEGIAAAAGLSTLSETFGGVKERSQDWEEFNRNHLIIKSTEEREIEKERARTEAKQIEAQGIMDANDALIAGRDAASSKANKGKMIATGIKAAGMLALKLLPLSDERTKNTVENIEDALNLLRKLRPVSFYYNDDFSESPERMHYGFIAQEYAHPMPDHTYYDESIDKLCIDTGELVAVLVRACQQLENRVQRLELSHSVLGAK